MNYGMWKDPCLKRLQPQTTIGLLLGGLHAGIWVTQWLTPPATWSISPTKIFIGSTRPTTPSIVSVELGSSLGLRENDSTLTVFILVLRVASAVRERGGYPDRRRENCHCQDQLPDRVSANLSFPLPRK
jgi:hypothetical protein